MPFSISADRVAGFARGATPEQLLKARAFLKQAAQRVDTDGDAFLSPSEVKAFVQKLFPNDVVDQDFSVGGTTFTSFLGAVGGALGTNVKVSDVAASLDRQLQGLIDQGVVNDEGRFVTSSPRGSSLIRAATRLAELDPVIHADVGNQTSVLDGLHARQLVALRTQLSDTLGLGDAVKGIDGEIRTLEAANTSKSAEVDRLVASIASREAEVKDEYERKRRVGILGVLFGVPMLGALSLIEMQRDDTRLKELRTMLTSARADQKNIQSKLADYAKLKASVLTQVGPAPVLPPLTLPPTGISEDAAILLLKSEALEQADRIRSYRESLITVRNAAQGVGTLLDSVIAKLTAAEAKATSMAEASRTATLELVKVLLAPDPNQAAMNRLKSMVKTELKTALKPLVEKILANVPAGPLRDELSKRLLDAMVKSFGA